MEASDRRKGGKTAGVESLGAYAESQTCVSCGRESVFWQQQEPAAATRARRIMGQRFDGQRVVDRGAAARTARCGGREQRSGAGAVSGTGNGARTEGIGLERIFEVARHHASSIG